MEKGNDCCTRTEPCVEVLVSAVLNTFALEMPSKINMKSIYFLMDCYVI